MTNKLLSSALSIVMWCSSLTTHKVVYTTHTIHPVCHNYNNLDSQPQSKIITKVMKLYNSTFMTVLVNGSSLVGD